MLPTFLSQFAAGCYLVVAASAIKQAGWRYLRLMAVVSLCLALISLLLLLRDPLASKDVYRSVVMYALAIGIAAGAIWLFANAGQGQNVRDTQRVWPAVAGLACMTAAVALVLRPDDLIRYPGPPRIGLANTAMAMTTLLGGLLLGCVTAAMLLGHRYLIDSDMAIAPLRRLTKTYLTIIAFRFLWLIVASLPVWSADFHPRGDYTWFWLMLIIRGGVGVVMTGIFAGMVWDCVKRRATQSATALFYLSMIFVFLGELAGQYLARTESLAL